MEACFYYWGGGKCHPRVNKVNKKKEAIFKNFSLSDFYEKFDLLICNVRILNLNLDFFTKILVYGISLFKNKI